jgi:uncharacterized protein YoxC
MITATMNDLPEANPVLLLPAFAQVSVPEGFALEPLRRVLDDGFIANPAADCLPDSAYAEVPGLEELVLAIQQATDARDADAGSALPSWEQLEAQLASAEEQVVNEAFEQLREADQAMQAAVLAAETNLKQARAQAEQKLDEAKSAVEALGGQVSQITGRADSMVAKAGALLAGDALAAFHAQVEALRQSELKTPLQQLEAASDRLARAERSAAQYVKGESPENANVEQLLLAEGAEGAQLRSAITRLIETRESYQPVFERALPRVGESIGLTEIQRRWQSLFDQVEFERQVEVNLQAAEQAAQSGQGREAQQRLELAMRGRADAERVKRVQELIAPALRQEKLRDLRTRLVDCARLSGAAAKIESIEKEAQALEHQEPSIYRDLTRAIAKQIAQARAEADKMAKVRFAVLAENIEAYYQGEAVIYSAPIEAEQGQVRVWKKEGSRWVLHVERWLEEQIDPSTGYVHYKLAERWPSKRVLAQDPRRLEAERRKWLERHSRTA